MLYLVTFCLPRFLDQDFDDKFVTLFHELYHISPDFDGDLRRHDGRYDLHSHSKKRLRPSTWPTWPAPTWPAARPGAARLPAPELRASCNSRHGSVVGVVVPRPKVVPLGAAVVQSAAVNR